MVGSVSPAELSDVWGSTRTSILLRLVPMILCLDQHVHADNTDFVGELRYNVGEDRTVMWGSCHYGKMKTDMPTQKLWELSPQQKHDLVLIYPQKIGLSPIGS